MGAAGDHVVDLQRRLAHLHFGAGPLTDQFTEQTAVAVKEFQASRGIDVDGVVGPQTWALLVEAGYELGDRLLYLRTPTMRGEDVARAQTMLSKMGFLAGRVDGIWGPKTAAALVEFQHNTALVADGVCGARTILALRRLSRRLSDRSIVAHIEEREQMPPGTGGLAGTRLAVGEAGGAGPLSAAVRRMLTAADAVVLPLSHPNWTAQANQANRFAAAVYVGFDIRPETANVAYFQGRHYVSEVGQQIASRVAERLVSSCGSVGLRGMALPILRDSSMPAVLLRLPSAMQAATTAHSIATVVHGALFDTLCAADASAT